MKPKWWLVSILFVLLIGGKIYGMSKSVEPNPASGFWQGNMSKGASLKGTPWQWIGEGENQFITLTLNDNGTGILVSDSPQKVEFTWSRKKDTVEIMPRVTTPTGPNIKPLIGKLDESGSFIFALDGRILTFGRMCL